MDAVILNPLIRKARDAVNPTRGPRIEKSNRDLREGGGDLKGVIAPSTPSWIEGTGVGSPISNY
jgi:hypothetical protein